MKSALSAVWTWLGWIALSALVRLPVLFDSVVDWDESLYLLVSRDLLHGALPYLETWDHKPPGIFYAFGLAQWIVGENVFASRALGVVCVGSTAWLLSRLYRTCWPGRAGAPVAALLYILLSTANGGFATNSELVFGSFVVLGFVVGLGGRAAPGVPRAAAAGVCFGAAFATKFVVAFDVLGFAALYAMLPVARPMAAHARVLAGFAAGGIAAVVLFALPYLVTGNASVLYESTVSYNLGYSEGGISVRELNQGLAALASLGGTWLAIGALALALLLGLAGGGGDGPDGRGKGVRGSLSSAEGGKALACFGWLFLALASVIVQGKLFPHHFLQLLPPACLLVALLLGWLEFALTSSSRRGRILRATLVVGFVFFAGSSGELRWRSERFAGNVAQGDLYRGDVPRQVAAGVLARSGPGATMYVYNYEPIVYHLAAARAATRFPFPLHLLLDEPDLLGVDKRGEIRRILASEPQWIVVLDGPESLDFDSYRDLGPVLRTSYREAFRHPTVTRDLDAACYRQRVEHAVAVVVYRRRDEERER